MKYKLTTQYVVTCEAEDDSYAFMWSTMYDSVKEAKEEIKERKDKGLPYYWDTIKIHKIRFKFRKTRWD